MMNIVKAMETKYVLKKQTHKKKLLHYEKVG
jgi:hypothetical protein